MLRLPESGGSIHISLVIEEKRKDFKGRKKIRKFIRYTLFITETQVRKPPHHPRFDISTVTPHSGAVYECMMPLCF